MKPITIIQSILLAVAITAALHLLNSINANGLTQFGISIVLIMIIAISFSAGMMQAAQSRPAAVDRAAGRAGERGG